MTRLLKLPCERPVGVGFWRKTADRRALQRIVSGAIDIDPQVVVELMERPATPGCPRRARLSGTEATPFSTRSRSPSSSGPDALDFRPRALLHALRASLFHPARGGRRSLGEVLANVSQRADVYLGCALRRLRAGDKAAIGQAWTLWAECDGPHVRSALEAFQSPPSLLVASGTPGNVHAYWALDRPVSVELVEDANRRLAHTIGADPVCYDASRILRPPGSRNHKHQPPAAITQLGPARRQPYRLADVIGALPPHLHSHRPPP